MPGTEAAGSSVGKANMVKVKLLSVLMDTFRQDDFSITALQILHLSLTDHLLFAIYIDRLKAMSILIR